MNAELLCIRYYRAISARCAQFNKLLKRLSDLLINFKRLEIIVRNRNTRNLLQFLRNRELDVRKSLTLPMRDFLTIRKDAMHWAFKVTSSDFTQEGFWRICNIPKGVQLVRECFGKVYDN